MADFNTLETSVQDAQPIELYSITLPGGTWYLTSSEEDVTFGGITYSKAQLQRGPSNAEVLGESRELMVTISVEHPIVQQLLGNGIPPRDALLVITSVHVPQLNDGVGAREVWRGYIVAISTSNQYAKFRIPSWTEDSIRRVYLPIANAQPLCNHMFGDTGCAKLVVDTALLPTPPTVASVSASGLVITLSDDLGAIDGYYNGGAVRFNGESRSIETHVGNDLTIDVPFASLPAGSKLTLIPGCDHTIGTCNDKFDNVLNFGGHPDMPSANPTAPTGYGVVVQA